MSSTYRSKWIGCGDPTGQSGATAFIATMLEDAAGDILPFTALWVEHRSKPSRPLLAPLTVRVAPGGQNPLLAGPELAGSCGSVGLCTVGRANEGSDRPAAGGGILIWAGIDSDSGTIHAQINAWQGAIRFFGKFAPAQRKEVSAEPGSNGSSPQRRTMSAQPGTPPFRAFHHRSGHPTEPRRFADATTTHTNPRRTEIALPRPLRERRTWFRSCWPVDCWGDGFGEVLLGLTGVAWLGTTRRCGRSA